MIELLDPEIEHYELAPPGNEDDVRASCREFDFEPNAELIEFATELGGRGFGYTKVPGVEGQGLSVIYSYIPDAEMRHTVLHARERHDEPGVLPGFVPIAYCNGNELWYRIADRHVLLWEHESWKTEQELVPVVPTLTELVAGLEPD